MMTGGNYSNAAFIHDNSNTYNPNVIGLHGESYELTVSPNVNNIQALERTQYNPDTQQHVSYGFNHGQP